MKAQPKKLSLTIKLVIVLAVLAIIFFSLALTSALYSVNRTIRAIDAIGTVEYSEESREKIDLANTYYNSLDDNLHLKTAITNSDTLNRAKLRYVAAVIWELHLADEANADGGNDAVVKNLIDEARTSYEEFFTQDASENIPNFHYLPEAEAKYGGNAVQSGNSSDGDQEEEEIELC